MALIVMVSLCCVTSRCLLCIEEVFLLSLYGGCGLELYIFAHF